jgi:hypothetical protein
MMDFTVKPPYHISSMAMILFGLSNLADSGTTDDITVAQVKKHVYDGDLIDFLTEKGGGVFGNGLLKSSSQKGFADWYVGRIRDLCVSMEGRERRKYAIQKRGICLLISYTAEIIQEGKDLTLQLPLTPPGPKRPS